METDLYIVSDATTPDFPEKAHRAALLARNHLETYIEANPLFRTSLEPVPVESSAPDIIRDMAAAAEIYGVGPMAAVAGAVAEFVGRALDTDCSHLIVENGGDIYLKSPEPVTLSVYAGEHSPFTGKLQFQLDTGGKPMGVCTSSATVGPSLSFGNTDAVVTVASTAYLADAAATAIGNRIKTPADIEPAIQDEVRRGLLDALIVVIGDKMGAWGNITFL